MVLEKKIFMKKQINEAMPELAWWFKGTQGHTLYCKAGTKTPVLFQTLAPNPFYFSFAQDDSKDFVSSSRRKQYGSSEFLLQADTPGKRTASKVELQDPESSSSAPPGLQGEEQVSQGRARTNV